ncbi:globin domain-containing protein [Chitinivorax sp. B]|uniref:globin domain-containing protein n=1 Tax=Chitinivorax sp. B TaxID=2502235 RepID=UPI0010FA1A50|nr:globin domain-containing protein [Chitinivorax sp. B]
MLTPEALSLIQATVPVLREQGEAITRHFYHRMFNHHPELKNLFNMGNQAAGEQQQALAGAVYAYAANIHNPAALAPVLERIAHKHVSLGITPAQYLIVGRHLLASIAEVLGSVATPAILAAWDEAYWLLAMELVAIEAKLYQQAGWQAGQAWRQVKVSRIEPASCDALSFYLQDPAGADLPVFEAGQYLSVALDVPAIGLRQIRQYSFSDAPDHRTWRITVRRVAQTNTPAGMMSNLLNDTVKVGDWLEVGPPAGEFVLNQVSDHPIMLLSAGVGVTPMVSMLKQLVLSQPQRQVLFGFAGTSVQQFPLWRDVRTAFTALPNSDCYLWFEGESEMDLPVAQVYSGRMQLSDVAVLPLDADIYLCGPLPFMRTQRQWLLAHGFDPSQIRYEVFGPDLLGGLD